MTTLVEVLYDERLTNEQRLVISRQMESEHPIQSAKIYADKFSTRLAFWVPSGNAYVCFPDGKVWSVTTVPYETA
jgi:hypothetical protein